MLNLGQRLHEARKQKGVTLEEAALATKIKSQFLVAIEGGDYQKLPSPAYAEGFVKNYAAYLGLPKTETLAVFRREFDAKKAYKVLPESLTKPKLFPLRRLRIHRSLLLMGVILLSVISYIVFQYRYLFLSPSLVITSPEETVVSSPEVTITGKTDPNATVFINNQQVTITPEGEFAKTIIFFPGRSVLTIKAKNRMGKKTITRQEIEVE